MGSASGVNSALTQLQLQGALKPWTVSLFVMVQGQEILAIKSILSQWAGFELSFASIRSVAFLMEVTFVCASVSCV